MSQFNITGTGFTVGDTITFAWDSPATTLATATVAGDGTIGPVQASVPAGSATGAHIISAKKGAVVIDTVGFTVDAPPAPTLAVSPTHGLAGSGITLAGTGWGAGSSVQVVFDNPTVVIATITADGSGAFSGQAATIPSGASVGAHSMAGRIGPTGSYLANALYNVDSPTAAALSVSPNSGPVGTNCFFDGTHFTPNALVTITDDMGPDFWTVTADSTGAFHLPNQTGPHSPAGVHTLTGTDNGSPVKSASCTFTVAASGPAITVTPTSGAGGSSITFNLSGFTPNAQVAIHSNLNSGWSVGLTVDGSGSFTGAVSTAPPSPNGAHTLTATDNGSPVRSASCIFTVGGAASLSVSPTSGPTNTPAAFTGNGFTPGSVVNITDNLSTQALTIQADSSGHFVTSAIATPAPAGVHHHTATDNGSPARSASCDFTNTSSGVSLVVSPASGPGSQNIAFSGSGYTPSSVVTVHDNMDAGFGPQFAVDGSGNFGPTFTPAPAGPPGAHVMTGADNGSPQRSAQTTFQKTSSSAATIVADKSSTWWGRKVLLTGSNWSPNENIQVTLGPGDQSLASLQADGAGNIPPTAALLFPCCPAHAAGSFPITATSPSHSASTPFSINAPSTDPLVAHTSCKPNVSSGIQWGWFRDPSCTNLTDADVQSLMHDVHVWLQNEVCPAWSIPVPSGSFFSSLDAIPSSFWIVAVTGNNPSNGGGVHYAVGRPLYEQPRADVFTLSSSGNPFPQSSIERIASHEAAEMIVDPGWTIESRIAFCPSGCGPDPNGTYYIVEVGDPTDFDTAAYSTGTFQTRQFTDFMLPNYFIAGSAGPWDKFGLLGGPFTYRARSVGIGQSGNPPC